MRMYPYFLKRFAVSLLAVGLIGIIPGSCRADDAAVDLPTAKEISTFGAVSLKRVELEAFVNEIFAKQMERLHVPGAALAFVQGENLVLAKGFGFANRDEKRPVVAEQTLFDVQSISKLFTVTAVMQGVERGHIGLDDEVNKHLNAFQIEPVFSEPIRLVHLITHTSGLEDKGIGITARREADALPLGEFLARSLPPRVRPPGEVMLYSDCGICLAGFALESAVGVPLAEFMEQNILRPLGMQRTRFFKLPPELACDLAVGYSYEGGQYKALPHDYEIIWPAASTMTTATDIARFMIAHLQNGRFGEVRILNEETAREIHKRQFSHHPRLAGVCYDFFEHFENGQRAIGHTGAGGGFVMELLLVPDHRVGYFLALNSANPELLHVFRKRFFERFFPSEATTSAASPNLPSPSHPEQLTGWYWSNRYDRRTIEKISSLVGGYVHVSANADGTLAINGQRYGEIEPLVFQRLGEVGPEYLAFRKDSSGNVRYLLAEKEASEKVSGYNTIPFHLGILAFVTFVFATSTIAWMCAFIVRRLRVGNSPQPKFARFSQLWANITSSLNLACILMVAVTLGRVELPSVASEFQTGLPRAMIATIACATLSVPLSLAIPVMAIVAWIKRYWSVAGRLCYSLIAVASLGYVWFFNFWNLIGFRY